MARRRRDRQWIFCFETTAVCVSALWSCFVRIGPSATIVLWWRGPSRKRSWWTGHYAVFTIMLLSSNAHGCWLSSSVSNWATIHPQTDWRLKLSILIHSDWWHPDQCRSISFQPYDLSQLKGTAKWAMIGKSLSERRRAKYDHHRRTRLAMGRNAGLGGTGGGIEIQLGRRAAAAFSVASGLLCDHFGQRFVARLRCARVTFAWFWPAIDSTVVLIVTCSRKEFRTWTQCGWRMSRRWRGQLDFCFDFAFNIFSPSNHFGRSLWLFGSVAVKTERQQPHDKHLDLLEYVICAVCFSVVFCSVRLFIGETFSFNVIIEIFVWRLLYMLTWKRTVFFIYSRLTVECGTWTLAILKTFCPWTYQQLFVRCWSTTSWRTQVPVYLASIRASAFKWTKTSNIKLFVVQQKIVLCSVIEWKRSKDERKIARCVQRATCWRNDSDLKTLCTTLFASLQQRKGPSLAKIFWQQRLFNFTNSISFVFRLFNQFNWFF